MKANFDGMRKNATHRMNYLGYKIKELLEMAKDGKYFVVEDFEDLINSFNSSAGAVDVLNCLYDNNVEDDINDLSDLINIDLIEVEEIQEEED